MPRYKSEHISKRAEELEKKIKEKYGSKRGRAMLVDARQCVEYEIDSPKYSQISFVRKYIEALERRL